MVNLICGDHLYDGQEFVKIISSTCVFPNIQSIKYLDIYLEKNMYKRFLKCVFYFYCCFFAVNVQVIKIIIVTVFVDASTH